LTSEEGEPLWRWGDRAARLLFFIVDNLKNSTRRAEYMGQKIGYQDEE